MMEVDWNIIPGYGPIVLAIISELEIREIHQYPDSLRKTTVSFLSNAKLLNRFLKITFGKTNVYDSAAVCSTLDLITMWLHKIHKNS
jgi:hypothetical protein